MSKEGTNKSVWDMLYLAACALHQTVPDADWAAQVDWKRAYRSSKYHGMASIACMGAEQAEAFAQADDALLKSWRETKEKAIRKNLLLDAERGQIFQELERMGIWYAPLKGILLQDFYPKYGMRQMSDNDILYDVSGQKELIAMMKKRGYKVESYPGSAHDVFKKPPVYSYEMHKSLFSKADGTQGYAYYQGIGEKLIKDGQGGYARRFSDEDFYIYQTAHAYKHYVHGGTGLRSLMDAYVYVRKKGGSMDWAYLGKELGKLEMAGFEEESRALAQKIFEKPMLPGTVRLTAKEQKLFVFLAGSGTYGTIENHVEKTLQKMEKEDGGSERGRKQKYLLRRLFPDMEWFRDSYPFLAKHRVLIPFFILYRMARGAIFRRKQIQSEFQAVKKAGSLVDKKGKRGKESHD